MGYFDVVYEDNHLLVVSKSSGVLVQGDISGDKPLVEICKEYVGEKYQKPGAVFLGVVHRIDRPVSGLVIFARTSKALERMNALFRDNKINKTYWAIVDDEPPEHRGTLVHWLIKDTTRNKTTAFTAETPGALRSELSYEVLGKAGGQWLLSVFPVTGRPHQIRVQLASMGSPIAGDLKYGSRTKFHEGAIGLHAKAVEFIHPVRKEDMTLRAPLPKVGGWSRFLSFEG